MATARDVAERAGTSTAVVSYVFNNGPRPVAEATRQRVLEAAAELDYKPNAVARALSAGRTFSLGLLIPQVRNPFFATLTEHLEIVARSHGHLLLIGDSAGDPAQESAHIGSFIERKVDGVVLVSLLAEPAIRRFHSAGVPVVALHPVPDGVTVSTLSIDYVAAAEAAVDHLLAHGYKTLAVLTGPEDSPGTAQHRAGVERALARHPKTTVRYTAGPVSRFAARDAVQAWFQQKRPPRAVYCATDEQAFGVLFAAWEAGLRVPEDVAVMGVDGTDECAVSIPPLASVRQPVDEIARQAVDVLLAAPDREAARVVLDFELVPRTSCGC
ncbi:LacI family DNA-binding transcriptional regulator [Kribbella sp. NPDC058245]|uniref:LacI family DNA-binding transcriptional regulator n=1 Tax=Kribbella sp. NPDC058245 TaxID=3346399 RepID=UPI0036EDD777